MALDLGISVGLKRYGDFAIGIPHPSRDGAFSFEWSDEFDNISLPSEEKLPYIWDMRVPTTVPGDRPNPEISYAGALPDGQGGTDSSGDPQVHEEGVWCGDDYTSANPVGLDGFNEFQVTYLNDVMTEDTSNNNHYLGYTGTYAAGTYTFQFKAKSTNRILGISWGAAGNATAYCHFDLQNGVLGSFTDCTSHIKNLGGDWYLCSVTVTLLASSALNVLMKDTDNSARFHQYTGDGVSTLEIKDFMSVESPYLYPYIPPATSVVSAASTTGGNGINVPMDTRMLECFRGEPDGVELFENATPNVYMQDNGDGTYTSLSGGTANINKPGAGVLNERYLYKFSVSGFSGGLVGVSSVSVSGGYYVASDGDYTIELIQDGTSPTDIRFISTVAGVTFSNLSVQKLETATLTLAAIVTMGVGSGELVGDTTSRNILSCAGTVVNPLYFRGETVEITSRISAASDGASSLRVENTWQRGDIHIKLVQTNSTGTQYRVGNLQIGIDSSVQWSAWANFDGSFNPVTYLRFMVINSVPMWMRQVQLWSDGEVDESEILKLAERYGHV